MDQKIPQRHFGLDSISIPIVRQKLPVCLLFLNSCHKFGEIAAARPSKDDLSGEIEKMAWITASQVRSALDFIDTNPKMRLEGSRDGSLFVPPKGTIANQMLTA